MTDQQAIEQFAAEGSEAAFRTMVERYSPMVYSVCNRTLNHTGEAEEAAQKVFLILSRKAGRLKKETLLSGWLYRTAIYVALRQKTKLKRRQILEKEFTQMETHTERETHWESVRPILDQAVAKLPQRLQAAVILHFFEGKTQKETGVMLGCGEDAVQMRIRRSLDQLRTLLSKRGATLSSGTLALYLTLNRMEAAPAHLNQTIMKSVASGIAQGTASMALAAAVWKSITLSPAVTVTTLLAVAGIGIIGITKNEFESSKQKKSISSLGAKGTPQKYKPIKAGSPPPTKPHRLTLEERFKRAISELKPTDDHSSELDDLAREFASVDPTHALELSKQIVSIDIQTNFIEHLFDELTRLNLQKAAQLAGTVHGYARQNILRTVGLEWTKKDPYAAASWVSKLPVDLIVSSAMETIFHEWVKSDPISTLKFIDHLTETDWNQDDLREMAITLWSNQDPNTVLGWLTNQINIKNQDELIVYAAGNLALMSNDPSLVILWAQQLPPGSSRDKILNKFIENFARRGFTEWAMYLTKQIDNKNQKREPTGSQEIGTILGRRKYMDEGLEPTLTWANQLPDGQKEGAFLAIISSWTKTDPVAAWRYLGKTKAIQSGQAWTQAFDDFRQNLPDGQIRTLYSELQTFPLSEEKKIELTGYLFERWGCEDMEVAWTAATKIPLGPVAEAAWNGIALHLNPKKFSLLPSDHSRDIALGNRAVNLAFPKPDVSIQLLNSIQNEKIRMDSIEKSSKELRRADRLLWLDWINQLNPPEQIKVELLKPVKHVYE